MSFTGFLTNGSPNKCLYALVEMRESLLLKPRGNFQFLRVTVRKHRMRTQSPGRARSTNLSTRKSHPIPHICMKLITHTSRPPQYTQLPWTLGYYNFKSVSRNWYLFMIYSWYTKLTLEVVTLSWITILSLYSYIGQHVTYNHCRYYVTSQQTLLLHFYRTVVKHVEMCFLIWLIYTIKNNQNLCLKIHNS